MPGTRVWICASAVAVLLIAGCSSSLTGSSGALRAGDPTRAAALAREAIARDANDPLSWRDLGIALYKLDRAQEAIDPLDRALAVRPRDRQALLFRARSLDALDRLPAAIAAYGAFLAESHGKEAEVARGRIEQLRVREIKIEVQRAIAREDSIAAAAVPKNSVAVPDFANPSASDTLRLIAKGLAAMTVTDLSQIDSLRVVERERLTTLVDELHRANPSAPPIESPAELAPSDSPRGQQERLAAMIDPGTNEPYYRGPIDGTPGPALTKAIKAFQGSSGLSADGIVGPKTRAALDDAYERNRPPALTAPVAPGFDAETTPRLGRLLGARRIVQGSVIPIGSDRLELHADMTDITDRGAMRSSGPVEGETRDVLDLQKRLVVEILGLLGIRPTDSERRAIERRQTHDLVAFLDYCRGLDYEDRGLAREALAQYREALARDPGFSLAGRSAAAIEVGGADLQNLERTETSSLSAPGIDPAQRAAETGEQMGVVPGVTTEVGLDQRTPDAIRPSETGTIVVRGDLPGGGKR